MSRIGKKPIAIPAGVTVTVTPDNMIKVKGPKGELSRSIHRNMNIAVEDNTITVMPKSNSKQDNALHGLTRTLIYNMVEGVTNGFQKGLDINGVGYRAQKQGNKLVLTVGYSHPVEIEEAQGITFEVPSPNKIIVKGIDKEKVGAVAANVRAVRVPDAYHGKGIKYETEVLKLKEGKTGKK
ncbi:MAG: large subunit ribosomal protein [Clostridiales bacterium]|jgi:large subunit ribosomal protein L6|nr:large subunit ribosomal protein [Clostridiales bacterium]MDK2903394.1 large subunit ribosomal protein [Clostridiales bacterium]MDK2992061.1 large subunit ribosomal protein [Clostridiales bacterium]